MKHEFDVLEAINADLSYHRRQCSSFLASLSIAHGLERIELRAKYDEHKRAIARLEQKKRETLYRNHANNVESAIELAVDFVNGRVTKRTDPEQLVDDIAWHRAQVRRLSNESLDNVNHDSNRREKIERHNSAVARLSLDLSALTRGVNHD